MTRPLIICVLCGEGSPCRDVPGTVSRSSARVPPLLPLPPDVDFQSRFAPHLPALPPASFGLLVRGPGAARDADARGVPPASARIPRRHRHRAHRPPRPRGQRTPRGHRFRRASARRRTAGAARHRPAFSRPGRRGSRRAGTSAGNPAGDRRHLAAGAQADGPESRVGNVARIGFVPRKPGNYRIRREPARHCVATVEAVVEVLAAFERDEARFAPLLRAFESMVDRQIAARAARTEPARRRLKPAGPWWESPAMPDLDALWPNLVAVAGEANAHRRGSGVEGPPELLQLAAVRPATGEVFQAFLAPRRPLAATAAHHLRGAARGVGGRTGGRRGAGGMAGIPATGRPPRGLGWIRLGIARARRLAARARTHRPASCGGAPVQAATGFGGRGGDGARRGSGLPAARAGSRRPHVARGRRIRRETPGREAGGIAIGRRRGQRRTENGRSNRAPASAPDDLGLPPSSFRSGPMLYTVNPRGVARA